MAKFQSRKRGIRQAKRLKAQFKGLGRKTFTRGFTGEPKESERILAQQNFEVLKSIAEHTETTADVQVERNERIKQSMHLSALDPVSITPEIEIGEEALRQRQRGLDIQSAITGGIRGAAPGISRLDESIIRKRSQNVIAQQSAQYQQEFGAELPTGFQEQIGGEQAAGFFGQEPGQRLRQRLGAAPGFAAAAVRPAMVKGATAGMSVGLLDFALQYAIPDPTMTSQERGIAAISAGAGAGALVGGYAAGKAFGGAAGTGMGPWVLGGIAAQETGKAMARAFKEELTVTAGTKQGMMGAYGQLAMAGLGEQIGEEELKRSASAHRLQQERLWTMKTRVAGVAGDDDETISKIVNIVGSALVGIGVGAITMNPAAGIAAGAVTYGLVD